MLKTFDELLEPAPQHKHFSAPDGQGPITFEDHYASVANIKLSLAAPAEITGAFDLARNAFVYSWFSYDLLMVSAPQALSTMEMALRVRITATGQTSGNLAGMIDKARKHGFLRPLDVGRRDSLHALREIRNDLMHGSTNQFDPNMTQMVLERVAETINELFPTPAE